MKKEIFHDIIPNEKRSIRNIPIPRKSSLTEDAAREEVVEEELAAAGEGMRSSGAAQAHEPEIHEKRVLRAAPKRRRRMSDGIRSDIEASVAQESEPRVDTDDIEGAETGTVEGRDEESFEAWQKKHRGPSKTTWTIVGAAIVGILFFLSMHFASATITISPTQHELALQPTTVPLSDVPMEAVTGQADASQTIEASGTITVDRKATGRVVMYNAYNSATQKLVANTRLETPNGLVYYTVNPVSIPGQKTSGGKSTPGSAEVDIVAAKTGDSYNQGLRDFKIVAYKGSDRYDKIYGRSKTALSGGYSGTVPNISQAAIASTTAALKQQISDQIDDQFTKEARSKDGYVYLPGTKTLQFDDAVQKVSSDGTKATISLTAKASGSIFEQSALSKAIIQIENASVTDGTSSEDTSNDSSSTASTTDSIAADEIVYTGDLSGLNVKSNASSLTISGTSSITSAIDTGKIAHAVSNLSKEQAVAALKKLVELDSVDISIWPWWKSTLPGADRITIKTEN